MPFHSDGAGHRRGQIRRLAIAVLNSNIRIRPSGLLGGLYLCLIGSGAFSFLTLLMTQCPLAFIGLFDN